MPSKHGTGGWGMSDAISRQEAINVINKYADRDITSTEKAVACDYCIELLKNLSSEQQWIPCSDRLPQTGTNVLVYYKDNDEHIGVIYGARPYLWEGDTYTPIAWMPLPEPYKEK